MPVRPFLAGLWIFVASMVHAALSSLGAALVMFLLALVFVMAFGFVLGEPSGEILFLLAISLAVPATWVGVNLSFWIAGRLFPLGWIRSFPIVSSAWMLAINMADTIGNLTRMEQLFSRPVYQMLAINFLTIMVFYFTTRNKVLT